jgi:hypothetical protein
MFHVWEYSKGGLPLTASCNCVYLNNIKVLTHTSVIFVGRVAIVEGNEKDQVAGLELTHIKNIVIFFHPMVGIQVTSRKFSAGTRETDIMRLESQVSVLQVKATMSLQERIAR